MSEPPPPPEKTNVPGGRWRELQADCAWIVGSWLRPAGSEAGWQQRLGRAPRPRPSLGQATESQGSSDQL
ncbi:MAG: hypothetical protein ACYC1C_17020 [Chloroflexota bacterium]